MKNAFIYILFVTLLTGCNKNGNGEFEQRLETQIKEVCENEGCTIDLSKMASFKWSKFYVFKETASLEVVENNINQKYPYFTDVGRRLVFLDESGKIVYHEDIFPSFDGVANKELVFYMPDTVDFMVYTNPKFTVTKEKLEKGYYYLLSQ